MNVSRKCCLQALCKDRESIRSKYEPDGFLILNYREPELALVCKPKRLALQAATYSDQGQLTFITAVPNSGQDICWLRVNKAGTRLFAVNNLPREEAKDQASTVTVFDVSGDKAEKPVELSRVELPMPLGTFVNNRNAMQPNSTAFQLDIDPSETYLGVLSQRINQTGSNPNRQGNILHMLKIASSGALTVVNSRHLGADGVHDDSRPQGIVTVDK